MENKPLDADKIDSFVCGNKKNLKEFYELLQS